MTKWWSLGCQIGGKASILGCHFSDPFKDVVFPKKNVAFPPKNVVFPPKSVVFPKTNVVFPQKMLYSPKKYVVFHQNNAVFPQKCGIPPKIWSSPKKVVFPKMDVWKCGYSPNTKSTNRDNPWPWIHLPAMNGLRFFNGFKMLNKQHKVSKHN